MSDARSARAVLVALGAAIVVAVSASSALANVYGIAYTFPSSSQGGYAVIRSTQLSPGAPGDFADNDVWAVGNGANTWVEGGLINGYWTSTLSYFSGYQAGGVFQIHIGPQPSYGVNYDDWEVNQGAGYWGTLLQPDGGGNPTWAYLYPPPFTSAPLLETGTETYTQSDHACSHQFNLLNYLGGSSYSAWSGTSVSGNNPPYIVTLSADSSYREYENAPGCS
ncbi:MAG: hypothetical protein M3071_12645 [Actinomycetota bacterium]|nr:hypothetical protein [Actinomycetota bacterium]